MIPDLDCVDLTRKFNEFTAVDNVSFSVPAGSFFSILGPSGCGKTTIMRMIAGFLDPTSGDIRIKGKSVLSTPPNKRPVNMVFQHLALFPMMNVADNIGYGLRRRKMPKPDITRRVGEVLERIGLPDIGTRKVDELSGGQKQRVAIARCMVMEPDVLLLDEPLGALDLKLREHMKIELKSLQAEFDTTFVYITHDQSEALVMSDQIAVMNHGRFEQTGTGQDLYYRPETAFVAGFIGESNRWQGRVERVNGNEMEMRTDTGMLMRGATHGRNLQVGDKAEIFVRPESIRVSQAAEELRKSDNHISGTVTSILFNGAASRILVRDASAREEIEVNLPQSGEYAGLKRGDEVYIGWSGNKGNCFPAEKGVMQSGTKLGLYLLLTPLILWLGLLIVIPHIDMFLVSIRERVGVRQYETSFANYLTFFTEPLYIWTFVRTAVMSILATAITLVIAFPVSLFIAKVSRGRLQQVLFVLCLIPFYVSELVRTFGWMILLRETGLVSNLLQWTGLADQPVEMLYNDAAIMIGLVYTSMLFMVVPLVTTLESLDDSVIEAGYDLGGSGLSVLREIIIPHAAPGIVSGSIVVFMLSLGNYLTPTMLGGKDSLWFTEMIYNQFIVRFNWELGAAFGFMLLFLSSVIVWGMLKLTRQSLEETMG